MSLDVIVAGGGMTGAATALGLSRAGFSVALVDAGHASMPVPQSAIGLRVSTLSPASLNLLQRLEAWPSALPERVQGFHAMEVWEAQAEQCLRFEAEDAGLEQLGVVVENALVQAALWQALERVGEVQLHPDIAVDDIRAGARGVRVSLADGGALRARMLVAADGAGSSVRERLGIGVESWDYGQRGLVAVVRPELSHRETARQRFLDTGPLAFLPLPEQCCSIVWSQPEDLAQQRLALDEPAFERELQDAFQNRLGAVELLGDRAAFPLRRQRCERYIDEGFALVGDAAHVVHPLAGQGVNLGFLDVAALIEVLQQARDAGEDFGSQACLRRYERWRVADNELMADALHLLKAFYELDVAGPLRRAGAGWLNRSRFMRARLIEHASGFGGEVPRLVARGISD